MFRPIIVTAALALAIPAIAQSPLPRLAGQVLLTGCRQGECAWMRISNLERVSGGPRGELRRLTHRIGSSRYGDIEPPGARPNIEWQREERVDYLFCSRQRPAYAFPEDGGRSYLIHYLDLFDLAGYQQSSGLLFMRVCHNRGLAGPAVLRRLGYRPGTRNEQVENARPEDMTRF